MKLYEVKDTVTYERVFYVAANDEDSAIDIAANGEVEPHREEQVGNSPYEATEIDGVGQCS